MLVQHRELKRCIHAILNIQPKWATCKNWKKVQHSISNTSIQKHNTNEKHIVLFNKQPKLRARRVHCHLIEKGLARGDLKTILLPANEGQCLTLVYHPHFEEIPLDSPQSYSQRLALSTSVGTFLLSPGAPLQTPTSFTDPISNGSSKPNP